MISGDNLETARSVAEQVGILSPSDKAIDGENIDVVDQHESQIHAMNADDFLKEVGQVTETDERGNETIVPENQMAFEKLMETLKVIGRADPSIKLLVAAGLARQGKKVAVVGDGINDIQAFQTSEVAFAMGSGQVLAKKNSDMVLTKDDFEGCIRAVMWGRNIFANVKRFLQFQVTCNFSTLIVVLIGFLYMTESPLKATQLLWINLIMDTLAGLALATSPPLASIIRTQGHSDGKLIMTKSMWKQIYGVTLWNVIVMMIIIFAGKSMFDLEYTAATQTSDDTEQGIAKRTHVTIIFNTFVFLQFFNEMNCRCIGPKDMNVFSHFFHNWIFIFILVIIFAVQWSACSWFTFILDTTALDSKQFYQCVVWGSTNLLVSILLKLLPDRFVDKVPVPINEDKIMGGETKLMRAYELAAQNPEEANEGTEGSFKPANSSDKNKTPGAKDDDFQAV